MVSKDPKIATRHTALMTLIDMVPRPIIDAALNVLADGRPRTADMILAEGNKRALFPTDMTRKRLYTALSQYVERANGRGRKPQLIEDDQHRFRINHAIDDWPEFDLTGLAPLATLPSPSPTVKAAIDALRRAGACPDPTAFEIAACNAFNCLGFVATHVGGNGAPDGYADALLGPLAYRIMIECKLSADIGDSHSAAAAEAAKFKAPYGADFCILVAPSYEGEVTFADELQVHNVSAWTTDDITQALQIGLDAVDLRPLFGAGFAEDGLSDLVWDRIHGRAKRLRVIASIVEHEGRRQQRLAAQLRNAGEAPRFDVDVAMSVVDTYLAAGGTTSGCDREDVQAAFEWLASGFVNHAVWLDESKSAIVLR